MAHTLKESPAEPVTYRAPRGGATFTVRSAPSITVHTVQSVTDDNRSRTVVGHLEVTYYGKYEQHGMTDSGGRVTVRYYFHGGTVTEWCEASAWRGANGRLTPFGEAGRRAIATAVMGATLEMAAQAGGWQALAHQAHEADKARRADGKRAEAARALAEVERIAVEVMPPFHGE